MFYAGASMLKQMFEQGRPPCIIPMQVPSFPGRRRMAWRLPRVQTVTSLPESCQYQSNFGTLSHDNSKTQLHHALKCHGHAHSISIVITRRTSVGALHDKFVQTTSASLQ